jgi:hypothetical protein
MLKSRHILTVTLALLLAGFGLGVVWLFQLRFNSGDIYPPYSSFRADPLGVKALYQSLQSIPGLSVRRFFQDSAKLQGSPQRVLFLFGTDADDLSQMSGSDFGILQRFLYSGGRVVIALSPEESLPGTRPREDSLTGRPGKPRSNKETPEEPPRRAESPTGTPENDRARKEPPARGPRRDEAAGDKMISFLDKNHLRLERERFFIPDATANRAELADSSNAPTGLPPSLSWHSAGYFSGLEADWRALYQLRRHAVLIERSFGPGSLVLSSDSFFLSNEAMRNERHAALLAWLIGDRREVLFDETHLGLEENPGIAALLRQYHLEGVLLGLLLIAGLFVWKNSAPLVPPPPDETLSSPSALVVGRESMAGFASLLRRSIPPAEILPVCFAEWKAACSRQPRAAARLPALEKIIADEQAHPARSRLPVQTWQTIQRILAERK